MKQSVLGMSAQAYRTQLHIRTGLCFAAGLLTLGLNLLLTALRTDSNHTWLLIANIAADILCLWGILYATEQHILPKWRLYKLFARPREQLTGTVTHISAQTRRYMDMDCHPVTVEDRQVFLPAGSLALKQEVYTFSLVSNVIMEAAQ